MAYLAYRADVAKSLRNLKEAAKRWMKSLVKIHDPFRLFPPTFRFVALVFWAGLKICFFTARKIVNR